MVCCGDGHCRKKPTLSASSETNESKIPIPFAWVSSIIVSESSKKDMVGIRVVVGGTLVIFKK